jgi:hypothetical protein
MSSMLTTPTSVPVAPECLYFKSSCICTRVPYWYTCTYPGTYTYTYTHVPWYVHMYVLLCPNIGKGHICALRTMCFGRIHGSQLREGANAGQHHTYTLATALTPLPRWQGLPRESPLQCLRACRLGYEPEPAYCTYHGTMSTVVLVPWYGHPMTDAYVVHSILRFHLDSDVSSADLHHNPRQHVGLHAHQRLHRLGLSGPAVPNDRPRRSVYPPKTHQVDVSARMPFSNIKL